MLSYEFRLFLNETAKEYFPTNSMKVGNKYNFRCPFCGDSHKSLSKKRGWWYLDTSSYYCFNCGISLSGIEFIKARAGDSFDDIKRKYFKLFASQEIQNKNTIQQEKKPNIFSFKNIINKNWKNPLSSSAYDYLENRKVLSAPFLKESFYSCYTKNNEKEFILIPWIINSFEAYYQLNDFHKYNENMKYIFPSSKQKLVYGLDNIDTTFPYIFVFEGVYDSIFVKNGIATGTKSISDYQYKLIKSRYPKHQIVISFDNDESGIKSMIKFINTTNTFKYFKWFNSDTKEKDINDFVISHNNVNIFTDTNKLEKMIANKLSMKLFLIKNKLWLE